MEAGAHEGELGHEQPMRRVQNMMSFDMWKYLWGLAGPAQCVELLSNLPMKVYMVPRNGEPAKVAACCVLCCQLPSFAWVRVVLVWCLCTLQASHRSMAYTRAMGSVTQRY